MQGYIEVKQEWTELNSLVAKDINGSIITLGASEGDTLKIISNTLSAFYYAGSKPTSGRLGSIELPIGEQVIIGIGADPVYIQGSGGTLTFELVKA